MHPLHIKVFNNRRNFEKHQFIAVFKDPHTYAFSLAYLADVIAGYGMLFWLPTIIKNLGFVSTTAQLMTIPPWIQFIVFATLPPSGSSNGVLYFMIFLGVSGSATFIPLIWAWRTSTTKGTTGNASKQRCKFTVTSSSRLPINTFVRYAYKSAATGIMNSFGNIGGAVGSFMFRSDWAPRYIPSFAICAVLAFISCGFVALEEYLQRRDRRKMASLEEEVKRSEEQSSGYAGAYEEPGPAYVA
ncbi:hypothetical protein HDU93_007728 [Gonapodya sp. JEL0774]|nr:hypothetical protein HDU93_007728 [Gonapodya sp. JEL0774]